jgi:hypothetical protein
MNNRLTQSQETNASRSQRLIRNAGFGCRRMVYNRATLNGIFKKGILK